MVPTRLLLILAALAAAPARAEDVAPTYGVTVTVRNSLDVWRNLSGGVKVGDTQLNKLQVSAALDGDLFGHPDWKLKAQYFRTNGESLSGGRLGDIQTASNIEALSADRLMELWIERDIWRRGAIRVGLMDLNADFDSIDPAGLFIGSSHGIAPELSHSGVNGPSIFPVSSFGVHGVWTPSETLALRAAVFDGVPGDPDHPKAFAAVKLSRRDGALMIGQADWTFAPDAQASLGVWGYTAKFDRLDRPGLRQSGQAGAYAYVAGPVPGLDNWTGWVRAGLADRRAAQVSSYLGAGLVRQAPFQGRPDDAWGFAVAHAGLGGPFRQGTDLPHAETAFELTYHLQVSPHVALQPDLQYIVHPASAPGLKNALAVGLRAVVVFRRPADSSLD